MPWTRSMDSRNPSTTILTLGSRRFWTDCRHPHPPHWNLGMAHGAFRSRVILLVQRPPHLSRLPLQLRHLRLPPRLLLRHWGQTTGTTMTSTTTIYLTRRLNNLHTLLADPDITTATLDHRYVMMIMLQSLN